MSDTDRVYCYDYFDCKEYDCVRRKRLEMNCWDIDDVKCKTHSKEFEKIKSVLGSKIEACKLCIYYKDSN